MLNVFCAQSQNEILQVSSVPVAVSVCCAVLSTLLLNRPTLYPFLSMTTCCRQLEMLLYSVGNNHTQDRIVGLTVNSVRASHLEVCKGGRFLIWLHTWCYTQ